MMLEGPNIIVLGRQRYVEIFFGKKALPPSLFFNKVNRASPLVPMWLIKSAKKESGPMDGPCHLFDPLLAGHSCSCLLCETESVMCQFCAYRTGTVHSRMEHENMPHEVCFVFLSLIQILKGQLDDI